MTRGDVHVGLRWLLTPWWCTAVGAGTGLGPITELGRHAAHPGVGPTWSRCSTGSCSASSTSARSTGSSHCAKGSGFQAPKGAFGGHVLAAQVLMSQLECIRCDTHFFFFLKLLQTFKLSSLRIYFKKFVVLKNYNNSVNKIHCYNTWKRSNTVRSQRNNQDKNVCVWF